MTGDEFVCFLCCCFFFDDSFRAGHSHAEQLHRSAGRGLAGASPDILSFFSRFFAFCGVLLPLGWWGSPCCVLSPFFSLVPGGRVGDFCHLLHSCIYLCRIRLGKPGRPACKPPGPCRPFSWPVPPFPSPAGSRRRYGSRERAAG